ncbi:hypothetical protein GCM10029992_45020 [Glycomyces albus]
MAAGQGRAAVDAEGDRAGEGGLGQAVQFGDRFGVDEDLLAEFGGEGAFGGGLGRPGEGDAVGSGVDGRGRFAGRGAFDAVADFGGRGQHRGVGAGLHRIQDGRRRERGGDGAGAFAQGVGFPDPGAGRGRQ